MSKALFRLRALDIQYDMNRFKTFFVDVVSGVLLSALGAPAAYLVFLAAYALNTSTLPRASDFEALPNMLIFEIPVGIILVPVVRAFVSKNRMWRRWAWGCFWLGAIFNPLTILALLAFCGVIQLPFV